jgi:single-strand DNA-binding protein
MSGVNKAIVVGFVGKDPEIRRTAAGVPIASFSVATSESWRDKATGERKEHTDWHNVVVFNEGLAKIVEQYVKKGSRIYVEGAMKTRKWEKDGVTRYVTEVVLGAFGASIQLLDRADGRAPPAGDASQYDAGSRDAPPIDEIPF